MSLSSLESEIVFYIYRSIGRRLRKKDLHEWSTSKEQVLKGLADGEEIVEVKELGVWAAIPTKAALRQEKKAATAK